MYFSGNFAIPSNSTSELFKAPQEKLVYNVYRLVITLHLAALLKIISLKVVNELKTLPRINISNLIT